MNSSIGMLLQIEQCADLVRKPGSIPSLWQRGFDLLVFEE